MKPVSLMMLALGVAACADMTRPETRLVPDAPVASTAPAPGTVVSTGALPASQPGQSPGGLSDYGAATTAGLGWYVVRVDGQMKVQPNAEYAEVCPGQRFHCPPEPPNYGALVGPGGIFEGTGYREVGPALRLAVKNVGTAWSFAPRPFATGASSAEYLVWTADESFVKMDRTPILYGYCWERCWMAYTVTGTQQVSVMAAAPPIRVDTARVGPATGEIRFEAVADGFGVSVYSWHFAPGDVGPEPTWLNNDFSGPFNERDIAECRGQPSCTYLPSTPGRIYVAAALTSGGGEILTNWSVTASPAVGQQPTMECKADKGGTVGRVVRGEHMTCTLGGFPAGVPITWRFDEDGNPAGTVTETRTSIEWKGVFVVGGTVSAQAPDGTSAAASVTVGARPWRPFGVRPDFRGHGGETTEPYKQTDRPERIGHLAHAHLPELPVPLDSAQVGGGPNAGYWYLRSFPADLPAVVHISRAWNPGSAWYNLQKSGPVLDSSGKPVLDPSGSPIRYCRKSQLAPMRPIAENHERDHVTQMDAFFRANSPITDLERFARHPADLAGAPFRSHVENAFLDVPSRAIQNGDRRVDHVPVGKVPLALYPCQLRYFP